MTSRRKWTVSAFVAALAAGGGVVALAASDSTSSAVPADNVTMTTSAGPEPGFVCMTFNGTGIPKDSTACASEAQLSKYGALYWRYPDATHRTFFGVAPPGNRDQVTLNGTQVKVGPDGVFSLPNVDAEQTVSVAETGTLGARSFDIPPASSFKEAAPASAP